MTAHTFSKKKIVLLIVALIGLFIMIGVGIFAFLHYQKEQELAKNPTLAAQVKAQSLVEKVGKLISLPPNEQPTIATVSDVTKLKNQPFFAHAKNGFTVLLYPKAKKAILYDPFNNKVVEVAPINADQATASASASTTASEVKVALYNGTVTVGLTKTIEHQLAQKLPEVAVVQKQNASRQDYAETLVIDVTGENKNLVAQLAKILGGKVGALPATEVQPADADVLVILGK